MVDTRGNFHRPEESARSVRELGSARYRGDADSYFSAYVYVASEAPWMQDTAAIAPLKASANRGIYWKG